jgi:hypothetical protein
VNRQSFEAERQQQLSQKPALTLTTLTTFVNTGRCGLKPTAIRGGKPTEGAGDTGFSSSAFSALTFFRLAGRLQPPAAWRKIRESKKGLMRI